VDRRTILGEWYRDPTCDSGSHPCYCHQIIVQNVHYPWFMPERLHSAFHGWFSGLLNGCLFSSPRRTIVGGAQLHYVYLLEFKPVTGGEC
jgi:hypothetical protein